MNVFILILSHDETVFHQCGSERDLMFSGRFLKFLSAWISVQLTETAGFKVDEVELQRQLALGIKLWWRKAEKKMKIWKPTTEHSGRLDALLLCTVCLGLLILLQRTSTCSACSHDNHWATFNCYWQSSGSFGPQQWADSRSVYLFLLVGAVSKSV